MLVNDFTNVSKILHAFKNCENCVFFLLFFSGILIFFVMCVIVVCDDLVMSGVFPVEDFNRYVVVSVEESALMCWGMTLNEFVLETLLANFIWGVLDTFLGLYLRVLLRCYVKSCTSISISIYLYKHINWIYIIIGESTKGIYIGSWL